MIWQAVVAWLVAGNATLRERVQVDGDNRYPCALLLNLTTEKFKDISTLVTNKSKLNKVIMIPTE